MKRSEMREQAFLLVFESLFDSGENIDELIELYSQNVCRVSKYAKQVFRAVCENKEAYTEIINTYSKNWKASRLSKVTLAILYVAIYEITSNDDVPDGVAVNEAVELAKKYATVADSSFINGVLGALIRSKSDVSGD